tara:strand:+ start:378729 stop:380684 length:1956 start_codon:yes stop_codon:yes gene_type:complete
VLIGRRLKRSRSHKNNPYKRIKPKTEAVSFDTPPLETNLRNVRSVFFQLVKPFKGLFALDIITYLGATVLNGFLPFMVSRLLDALQQDFEVGDFTFSDHSFEVLVIFMSIAVVSTVLYRLNSLVLANFEPAFRALSRARLTDYTLSRSVTFLGDKFAGRLVHAINEITRASHALIDHLRWSFMEPLITSFILIGTAMTVHPYFSILLVVWLVLYIGGIVGMTLGLSNLIESVAEKKGRGSAMITDSITNYLTVKLFAAKQTEMTLLQKMLGEEANAGRKFLLAVFGIHAYQGLLEITLFGGSAALIYWLWQQQGITIGEISLILGSAVMLSEYLWSFSSQVITFTEDVGSMAESLNQINEEVAESKEKAAAVPVAPSEPQDKDAPAEKGEIIFNNLSFSYNKESELFKGFQLHVKAGEKIGVVGHSGSGKSTLVNLLLKFYDVNDNEIIIDRQNITKMNPNSVRKNIAVIPQNANLFNRSVMENIRYGRLDATDEEVIEAAKVAHAHDFILNLENQYDTQLGDRGMKLSGGQRQRIAIARAILKDAPILVLDEATSALDTESEYHIQQALEKVMQGRTVLAIAHRLSTIVNMDRIIVMEGGSVVEDGSHHELMEQNGRYAELWNMQSNAVNSQTEEEPDNGPSLEDLEDEY